MTDLNDLVSEDASIYMVFATWINDVGEITGFGVDKKTEEIHAFLASPIQPAVSAGLNSPPAIRVLPMSVRRRLQQRLPIGQTNNLGVGRR